MRFEENERKKERRSRGEGEGRKAEGRGRNPSNTPLEAGGLAAGQYLITDNYRL